MKFSAPPSTFAPSRLAAAPRKTSISSAGPGSQAPPHRTRRPGSPASRPAAPAARARSGSVAAPSRGSGSGAGRCRRRTPAPPRRGSRQRVGQGGAASSAVGSRCGRSGPRRRGGAEPRGGGVALDHHRIKHDHRAGGGGLRQGTRRVKGENAAVPSSEICRVVRLWAMGCNRCIRSGYCRHGGRQNVGDRLAKACGDARRDEPCAHRKINRTHGDLKWKMSPRGAHHCRRARGPGPAAGASRAAELAFRRAAWQARKRRRRHGQERPLPRPFADLWLMPHRPFLLAAAAWAAVAILWWQWGAALGLALPVLAPPPCGTRMRCWPAWAARRRRAIC